MGNGRAFRNHGTPSLWGPEQQTLHLHISSKLLLDDNLHNARYIEGPLKLLVSALSRLKLSHGAKSIWQAPLPQVLRHLAPLLHTAWYVQMDLHTICFYICQVGRRDT
jgi:hypothetical protein